MVLRTTAHAPFVDVDVDAVSREPERPHFVEVPLHLGHELRCGEPLEALDREPTPADTRVDHAVVITEARHVHADDRARRPVVRHVSPRRLHHKARRDELLVGLTRELTLHTHLEEVRVFAVLLAPLLHLLLVRDEHTSAVNLTSAPDVLALPEAFAETPRVSRRIAEHEHHRLTVGQTTFRHFPDHVRDCRGLVENVEGSRGRRMLACKRFGVFFLTRLRVNAPSLRCLLRLDGLRLDLEHVGEDRAL